jgi:hypothetical protein
MQLLQSATESIRGDTTTVGARCAVIAIGLKVCGGHLSLGGDRASLRSLQAYDGEAKPLPLRYGVVAFTLR